MQPGYSSRDLPILHRGVSGSAGPSPRSVRTWSAILFGALAAVGCARVVVSPAPANVRTIVVFPVDNRTGSELFADAPPLLSILRDSPATRVTVPEFLAAEFRRQLTARGFTVVEPVQPKDASAATPHDAAEAARRLGALGIDATALYVQLWRWDPDDPSHLTYVDVELDVALVAPASGQIVWNARWPASPVDAGGLSSVSLAYPDVVRRVVAESIADLRATPDPAPAP